MAAYLVDTNVLLRFAQRTHPLHTVTRHAVRTLKAAGETLFVTPQNCVETWNVATRPIARNGFGMTPAKAERLLRLIERVFALLPDTPAVYPEWRRIVTAAQVSGVQVHDARLVAFMQVYQVERILTFNGSDFVRYAAHTPPSGIVPVDPATI